jgi:gas vesicle protein
MEKGKIVLGVLGGIAVGALLGVLFAPEKGSITRRKISKKGEEYLDDIKDKFDEFLDSVSEKYTEVKDMVTN